MDATRRAARSSCSTGLEFMRQAPQFERNLARSGLHLVKFWFSVSRKEQRRRFKERKSHPLKQWKLTGRPLDPPLVGRASVVYERGEHRI